MSVDPCVVSDILDKDVTELERCFNMSNDEVKCLIKKASLVALPYRIMPVNQVHTCYKAFEAVQRKVSVGCKVLDASLNGGLMVQGITEFSGESGSGKTQICLQLSTVVPLKYGSGGLDGSVAYISTENAFPIKRLCQIIDCKSSSTNHIGRHLLDRILIEHINDLEGLFDFLKIKVPVMIMKHNVKLIIIDSVAALFRCDENMADAKEKAKKLYSLGALLHMLNRENGVAVICINQVGQIRNCGKIASDWWPDGPGHQSESPLRRSVAGSKPVSDDLSCEHLKKPSLGLSWSNVVTTRIMISRCSTQYQEPVETMKPPIVIRNWDIMYSPYLPNATLKFFVNSTGVHGLQ